MMLEDYFQQPQFSTPRRLILSVEGTQKVGKTTLGLSACTEGLVAMLNYDFGLEGVIDQFKDMPILIMSLDAVSHLDMPKEAAEPLYKAAWAKAKEAYYTALRDARVKTLLVDTATEAWDCSRLAHFGRLSQVPPHLYTEINSEFRKMIRDAYERPDLNLILIHSCKDEYVGKDRTGRQVFSGFNEVPKLVQMVLRMWKHDGKYGGTIIDCRQKRMLDGIEIPAEILNFAQLLRLVHGD